jgi:hypothetical protein
MTCIPIPGGIVCVSSGPNDVDLKPFGSCVMMDFDKRFGPLFYRKNGRVIPNPTPRMWAAFDAWREENLKEKP